MNLRPLDCISSAHACSAERDGMVHPALLLDGVPSGTRATPALIEMLISSN